MRRVIFGLAIGIIAALSPSWGLANDTQIAGQIRSDLRTQEKLGILRGFTINITVEDGTVWLTGRVSDADQQALALDIARRTSGVKRVINGLSVAPGATLKSLVIAEGDIKINRSSRILGNVTVKGGKIVVGPNCIIDGSIECSGDIKIDEKSVVKGSVHSRSSIILHKTARVCQAVNAEKGVYLRTCVK